MRIKIILATFFLQAFTFLNVFSQLSLYPTSVFINPDTRSGSMVITNVSNEEREIDIYFKFGYLKYDSLGSGKVVYDDTVAEKQFSLIPYVKVYPSRLVIPAGEQQTVRFIVSNTNVLLDGVYWSRLFVKSSPIVAQIDTIRVGQVSAGIRLETEMVGLIAFQKGTIQASIDISLIKVESDSVNVSLLWQINKSGNSPFWGSMKYQLFDNSDEFILDGTDLMAFYQNCVFKTYLPSKDLKKGTYKLVMDISNQRDDIPEDRWVDFKKITKEFEIDLIND
jgi:hypothetical protein